MTSERSQFILAHCLFVNINSLALVTQILDELGAVNIERAEVDSSWNLVLHTAVSNHHDILEHIPQ